MCVCVCVCVSLLSMCVSECMDPSMIVGFPDPLIPLIASRSLQCLFYTFT